MATNRNMKMPGVWAKDALTTIPQPPVSGIAYRNDSLTEAEANEGQKYGSIGDSAVWNQELWAATTLLKELESQGILSWSPLVDYSVNAMVMGSNDKLYSALQASGPSTAPQDPVNDSTQTYWIPMEDLYGAKRNPGELVYSMLPIEDASLHLVDGTVLSGSGMYADFVSYVAGLIENQPNSSNVFKVGNLADVDNVLSSFTNSSYAKLPFAFSPGSNPWEMVFKITTGGDVTTQQDITGSSIAINPAQIYLDSGKLAIILSSNGTTLDIADRITGSYSVLVNTTYWLKLQFTGTSYILSYSTDGNTYINDITISSTSSVYGGTLFYLGTDPADPGTAVSFSGSIDLTGSYININNARWWSGTHKAGFMDEAEWQATVSKYKACGCFVYDEVTNTLRLPKVTGFVEGTVDPTALGQLVEAGMPNITGSPQGRIDAETGSSGTGAIKISTINLNYRFMAEVASGWKLAGQTFDASRSSPIYGNSATVQPQAIKGFVYMVVANRTKTQIVADIDEIAADLQLKADVDLGNVTAPGNVRMAHAAMPSAQYIDLTLPASGGEVTAPADGWFYFAKEAGAANLSVALNVYSSDNIFLFSNICFAVGSTSVVRCFVPVVKNNIVVPSYNATGDTKYFRFYYANGSAS